MRVLIDACVLSEVQRPNPDPVVKARLAGVSPNDIFLSVITVGEIVNGITRLPISARRSALEVWLAKIERLHGSRILPIDRAIATLWGKVTARAAKAGRIIPAADGLIAATALRHDLHVMTRNTPDFQATGCLLLDPWKT